MLFSDRSDDGAIACVDVFLVNSQIDVLGAPFARKKTPLREVDLVQVDKELFGGFCIGELAQRLVAVIFVMGSDDIGNGLLLADFLAFEAMFEVKSAEGGDSDPFVWVDAVEADCALVEGEATPLFECALVQKEVDVLLFKHAHSL